MQLLREDIQLGVGTAFRLLRWTRGVEDVDVVLKAGRTSPLRGQGDHWHYHRAMELAFVKRGAGTRFVADHVELFESGDLVLIGPNVPHYWHFRDVSTGLAVQWDFPLEHGIWDFDEVSPLQALGELAKRGLQIRGATALAIRRRMEELLTHDGLNRLGLFLQLVAVLIAAPAGDLRPLTAKPFSGSGTAEHQEAMSHAMSYILANYREPLRLATLLRLTGMSRATFVRHFRRHAGKTYSNFLGEVRLQAVCHALRETTKPIGCIALDHGFNHLSFFNRLFRRRIGVNPTEYRTTGNFNGLSFQLAQQPRRLRADPGLGLHFEER